MLAMLFSVLLTFLLSVAMVPLSIWLSGRLGAMDIPGEHRRMHARPMARLGGVGMYAALLAGAGAAFWGERRVLLFLLGGLLILLLGVIDDMHPLGAWQKLLWELACAGVTLWYGGGMRGWQWAAAVVWVTVICNVHNLIDGMDGLLAGTVGIEALFLGLVLLVRSRPTEGGLGLVLSAAAWGFWLFNRHPAFLFAGDSGALMLGFLLGLLSLPLLFFGEEPTLCLSPLFLFAYPLTDLAAALLRRGLRGKPLFAPDRGHLHHRIYDAGPGQRETVGVLHLLTLAGCVPAVLPGMGDRWEGLGALGCFAAAGILFFCRKYIAGFANKG